MDRQAAYNVLDLHLNAGEEDIKAAYKRLAQKYDAQNYEAGPLREEAERKMNEINEAFDVLMGYLRTGSDNGQQTVSRGAAAPGRYPAIRQLITAGKIDEALGELQAVPHGSTDAEWNFLMGSAYYYKGWLDQALGYFREAVRLDPGNREYEAALQNLQRSQGGQMFGNPYENRGGEAQALNCACNTCSLMCCMDACCSMCRTF